jgi:hypothetical protein
LVRAAVGDAEGRNATVDDRDPARREHLAVERVLLQVRELPL